MTREEYEEKRRKLSADAEEARESLNRARAAYEGVTDQLRELRIEWQEQQKAADQ
ncbi:hypothetical protein ACIBI8_37530 [Streptomyces sp. NPDC050529]|uniref:hypothetical protein n=1 Tax=Streptomyces sp. NPDC050529 TaxID=3365624 RepID=UPI0037AD058E